MKLPVISDDGKAVAVEIGKEMMANIATAVNPPAAFNNVVADSYNGLAPTKYGTAFDQFKAVLGLSDLSTASAQNALAASKQPFAAPPREFGSLLYGDGTLRGTTFSANVGNGQSYSTPFGSEARAFVTIAMVDEVLSALTRDRTSDSQNFDRMVARTENIPGNVYVQPVVDFQRAGGPEYAQATRVVEGAKPPDMLFIRSSERAMTIPAWNIGISFTDQSLKNAKIDYVTRTLEYYFQKERGTRVYNYLDALFNGDLDGITGAVPSVKAVTLDPSILAADSLSHKAWMLFLARNRFKRQLNWLIMTTRTRLMFEARTGRPGSHATDPTLMRLDPQGRVVNPLGMDKDLEIFEVDSISDGGVMPDGEIWAIDSRYAIQKVIDIQAAYRGVESFAMTRTSQMRIDWSEMVVRLLGNSDLGPFDRLSLTL